MVQANDKLVVRIGNEQTHGSPPVKMSISVESHLHYEMNDVGR